MSDGLFDELLDSPVPPPPAADSPVPLRRGINYAHEQMADLILANPGIPQGRIAELMGYSESWVSQIFNSDAFSSYLAKRREALIEPALKTKIDEAFDGLINRSLEVLKDKLDLPSNMVPDQLAVRVLDVAARARGYGAKSDDRPTVVVNVNQHLEELGGGLETLLRRRRQVIEAESPNPPPELAHG
jgi:hypothetical protein